MKNIVFTFTQDLHYSENYAALRKDQSLNFMRLYKITRERESGRDLS